MLSLFEYADSRNCTVPNRDYKKTAAQAENFRVPAD